MLQQDAKREALCLRVRSDGRKREGTSQGEDAGAGAGGGKCPMEPSQDPSRPPQREARRQTRAKVCQGDDQSSESAIQSSRLLGSETHRRHRRNETTQHMRRRHPRNDSGPQNMKTKPRKLNAADSPVHLVELMLTFSNVVADMKRMTVSVERLAKKLNRAMRNGTKGASTTPTE